MAEHEDLICSIWSTHRGIPLTDAAQKSAQKTKYLKKSFNVTWGMFDVDFDTQWWNTKAKHSQADLIFLLTYRYLIYRKTTICAILIGFWKISQLQLYIYIYKKKTSRSPVTCFPRSLDCPHSPYTQSVFQFWWIKFWGLFVFCTN